MQLPEQGFAVEQREIWHRAELRADDEVTAWITNTGWSFVLGREDLALYPALEVIVTPSTGMDHIDVEACQERDVAVYSLLDDRESLEEISASAEFTMLLLLSTLRRLPRAAEHARNGLWRSDAEDELRGRELQGRRVGLVGLGRIGRRMARYCRSFGADVSYFDPYVESREVNRARSLAELVSTVASLVICCASTPETRHMVDAEILDGLGPNATIVNTSRGAVIRECDLAAFLHRRQDVSAALDVLEGEPGATQFESPLWKLVDNDRIVVTPHVAGATYESQHKAAVVSLGLVARHLAERGR